MKPLILLVVTAITSFAFGASESDLDFATGKIPHYYLKFEPPYQIDFEFVQSNVLFDCGDALIKSQANDTPKNLEELKACYLEKSANLEPHDQAYMIDVVMIKNKTCSKRLTTFISECMNKEYPRIEESFVNDDPCNAFRYYHNKAIRTSTAGNNALRMAKKYKDYLEFSNNIRQRAQNFYQIAEEELNKAREAAKLCN